MLERCLKTFKESSMVSLHYPLKYKIFDICDALKQMGYQDEIHVVPRDMDTSKLRGAYYQWTERSGVYSEPRLVSLVVFPEASPPYEQRVICAKELVHVCESNVTKAKNADEVMAIAATLCGHAPDSMSPSVSLKAASDIIAQAQALTLLFPRAARIIVRQMIQDGKMDRCDLHKLVCVPQALVEQLLDEEWERVADALKDL